LELTDKKKNCHKPRSLGATAGTALMTFFEEATFEFLSLNYEIMEKDYKNISYFFVAVLVISIFGFFKSYFSLFPNFIGLTYVHHIHLISLLIWFALLILQPILIYQKKFQTHKNLGKFSYFLVPIMVFLMLMIAKFVYLQRAEHNVPEDINVGILYLSAGSLFPFVIFYVLAIINKKKPKYHMRYMIATSVALLGPGIGRIKFGFTDFTQAVMFAWALADLFLVGLIIFEYFKGKIYQPYVISLVICLFFHGIYPFFSSTGLWKTIASSFIHLF
jgi:Uncharacterised protein family (UPF0014)